jgi:hypothetical protein
MAEERVQRRLAAILAADVVGYSRLVEQDEAATLSTLKERRKGILGTTGRRQLIVNHTPMCASVRQFAVIAITHYYQGQRSQILQPG